MDPTTRKKVRRVLLGGIVLLFLGLVGTFVRGCISKGPEELLSLVSTNLEFTSSDAPRVVDFLEDWTLRLEQCRLALDVQRTECQGVSFDGVTNQGEKIRVAAGRTLSDVEVTEIDLLGGVQVRFATDLVLDVGEAHLSRDKRLITSDDAVRIQSQGVTLLGKGMVVDLDNEVFRLKSGVVMSIDPEALDG